MCICARTTANIWWNNDQIHKQKNPKMMPRQAHLRVLRHFFVSASTCARVVSTSPWTRNFLYSLYVCVLLSRNFRSMWWRTAETTWSPWPQPFNAVEAIWGSSESPWQCTEKCMQNILVVSPVLKQKHFATCSCSLTRSLTGVDVPRRGSYKFVHVF